MAELGALSLRIQAEGEGAVTAALTRVDAKAKNVSVTVDQAAAALTKLGISATVSGGQILVADSAMTSATSIVKQLGVNAVVTSAAQQQLAGATKTQTAATVQGTVAQQQATAAVTQGTAAVTTQTTATQVQTAATTRQTAQIGRLGTQARATGRQLNLFGREGRGSMIGLGFAISQMASTGEASLLSLARQIATVTSLLSGKLGIAGIVGAVGIGVFDFIRARAKVQGEIARDRAIQGARDSASIQKAQLQLDEANQRFAFEEGLTAVREFYRRRSDIIRQSTEAEIRAKRSEAAALSQPIAGEGKKETADRLNAQRKLFAEIRTLEFQSQAQQVENTAARIAAERQAAETIRGFESQRLEAQGRAHEARLQQIEVEAQEFRRSLGPAPDAEARVKAFKDSQTQLANLQQSQLDIERLQADLETRRIGVQNELAAGKIDQEEASQRIADIERAALPTLREMVQRALQFAAALGDEGAVAALRQLQVELEGLGVNLRPLEKSLRESILRGGPSVKAAAQEALDRIANTIGPIPFEVQAEIEFAIQAAQNVDQLFASALPNIAGALTDTLGAAFSDGISGAGDVLLRSLGGIMQQMGAALIAYGLAMQGLLPALLNPFTSGPAAIAAGVALVALGGVLGGIASGRGKGGGAGGGSASAVGGMDAIRGFVFGPNALTPLGEVPKGIRETVDRLRDVTASSAPSGGMAAARLASFGPTIVPASLFGGMQPLVVNTPSGQAFMARDIVNDYNRNRGGG